VKLRTRFLFSPGDSSGSSSSEPTLEQVQQQLREYETKFQALQAKVDLGKLVDPESFLKTKIEAGEVFAKDRYVGLQQTLQREQEKAAKAAEALAALQGTHAEVTARLSSLETETTALKGTNEEKDLELETLRYDKKRALLIFEKFPELAPFEVSGLLPEGEEEKLEEIFGAFAGKLQTVKTDATKSFVQGGGDNSPGPKEAKEVKTADSAEAHLKAAHAALANSDRVLYDKEYDAYLGALEK
jgi:hypothetical protein